MSPRPKRRLTIKTDVPLKVPRKWKDEEMDILLKCETKYGHKNLDKIKESLPNRSMQNIKTFMRTVFDTAAKLSKDGIFDFWISHCDAIGGTPWRDCLQIAQLLKYLSVDGLLENHPLPERCEGIDFGQAYRLVYQAMMGYPIQAVNKPTIDFVTETLAELNGEIKKQTDAIKKLESFLHRKTADDKSNPDDKMVASGSADLQVTKPVKVYQRKKPKSSNADIVPSLRITIEEETGNSISDPKLFKDFSVKVEVGGSIESTTVNVPVAHEVAVDKDEQELLKSISYNPFELPEKWLKEPLYLNLAQNL